VKLGQLFEGVEAHLPAGAAEVEVGALEVDSRKAGPGALFAALPGRQADGARFAAEAVDRGAAAVLASRPLPLAVPCVVAADPRRAFALAAARFHGRPSEKLRLVGVTGTNGKTTTTHLVEQLAAALGQRAGLIGTVEWRWPGERIAATHTTPESHELQALLARMAAARVEIAAMEVSSHGLSQERATGCRFAAAVFTNLTRDHLDYHGTMEAYFAAKARLFRELLPRGAPGVVNLDDEHGRLLAAERECIGYSVRGAPAGLEARELRSGLDGISFALVSRWGEGRIDSPLIGAHNAENLLAALAALLSLGAPLEDLSRAVPAARGAPGRLERVDDPAGRIVLVDYAHTDDALARVLDTLLTASRKPQSASRLICVFGCGGDRDRGKRPLMGEAASRRAHLTIATSDNPRGEDPMAILRDVEPGLVRGSGAYRIVPDRREAISLALKEARSGDVVLIAGKGHEAWQIAGGVKHEFDDRVEARRALEQP